ncbi:thioredoxin family protein [Pontiellaceae bacterium B12219]|nr:thioredoxin family protein [Pontiellaceae bacterium B12219]
MKISEPELKPSAERESTNGRSITRLLWRGFWLAFLAGSLAYAWLCFYVPSNSVSWAPSYTDARTLAVQSGKPMVLFFTSTWCVPCRVMKRTVWADEEVASEVNKRCIPLMLYADDPGAAEVFNRYQVGATPTTIITDPQGNVIHWIHGKMEKEDFIKLLEIL